MKNDIKIDVMYSTLNNYTIKKRVSRQEFYCVVKTRNFFKLLKEYFDDFTGLSCKHPQFMSNRYFSSLESIKNHIQISIKIDDENR